MLTQFRHICFFPFTIYYFEISILTRCIHFYRERQIHWTIFFSLYKFISLLIYPLRIDLLHMMDRKIINQILKIIFLQYYQLKNIIRDQKNTEMQSQQNLRSRSNSRKKKKDKKNKEKEKDKQRKQRRESSSSSRSDNDKKKKKDKDKDKLKSKKKSRSRERSREKRKQKIKDKKKSRSRSKQLDKKKLKEGNQKSEKIIEEPRVQSPKKEKQMSQIERARKFAMRQVRARLLKFNALNDDNDSDDSEKNQKKQTQNNFVKSQKLQLKPSIANPVSSIPKQNQRKRESKWGKNSSNQPNILMVSNQQSSLASENLAGKPSLEIEPQDDLLKLSQDKSIDIQENNQNKPDEQEIDPLDEYMRQIQPQAVPQMETWKKGQKGVITFEDVVTKTYSHASNQMQNQNTQQNQEEFKKKFLQAVSNIDEVKASQGNKGVVMQNQQERQSDFSDYKEEPQEQLDFFAKQRKMAERKQLAQVDHSKIEYEQVTFDLYREADEVKNLDPKQVVKFRKQAGDIKIRGKQVLNPVFNWYQCGFSDSLLAVIEKNKFDKPFPIQAQSIPVILSGRDVIGIAQTGSGKTFAYLLPMIKHVAHQRPVEEGEGPIGIIMTPTRQLANQVFIEAKKFCKQTRIRIVAVYGGLQIQKQLSDLKKGAQIIICTPGRMIDILTLNKGRISNLRRVSFLVIDEADRMFDLGFEPQITRIFDNVRPHRQTVMFSATFPKNVQNLARRILTNPVQILVGTRGQACRNVEQIVQVREQTSKFFRLLQILGIWNEKGSILIFIDKQNEADYLYQELLKYGYDCLVLHGAMDPTDRQFTIYDFKKGIKTIMISTSVSARGLDIKQIVMVINFKCPNHLEDYIHRIGRTGRAGNKGTAITFITPQEQQYSIDLIKALEMSQIHPPQDLIKMSQQYLKKVKKGQARKIRNRNIQGDGFKFDKDEQQKASQIQDMLKKQFKNQGLGFQDSDDDDLDKKKKKQQQLRGRGQQDNVIQAIKNPEIKNKLLNQAVKVVSEAITKGSAMTTQKLLAIAVSSIKQSITKHKVITSVDEGVEQVTKLINSFQSKGNGEGIDYFSYDFQINDYPNGARQRACSQHFLGQIQKDNNCTISLRGTYVEPGKKAPIGCRKLYLHIQSQDKSYVSNAYKDIKRVLEQGAFQNMHMSALGKYTI